MKIVNDSSKAINLMHEVSKWMKSAGLVDSEWWEPKNMNEKFMFKHAEPYEFFVAIVDGKTAASVILQDNERNQSWKFIDKNKPQKALYIHWLTVNREFAGKNMPKDLVEFTTKEALKKNLKLIRLDTDANQPKLMKIYNNLGFKLMGIEQEGNHKTAYFQKAIK
ncbi:GNAT family N-acetyltransferase [Candidatus Woesebacteria bacterium]|nr:GNAT family N-acetyltransferase [Candidatus Woesebacteria bacterium]